MQNKKFTLGSGLAALAFSAVVLGLSAVALSAYAQTRPCFVPSGSMLPNLAVSSTIKVRLNAYETIANVKRGDVVISTRVQKGSRTDSIKRVIGLPGDKIGMNGTALTINGRVLPHTLMHKVGKVSVYLETNGAAKYPVQYGDNSAPAAPFSGVVPQGTLFCLGDNRDNSYDSRYLGSVPFGDISGKKTP